MSVLEVENLRTYFQTEAGVARAVDGVSFALEAGESLALVGESACGKSVTALSIMRLIEPPSGYHPSGSIRFEGTELLHAAEPTLTANDGRHLAHAGALLEQVFAGLEFAARVEREHPADEDDARIVALFEQMPHDRLGALPLVDHDRIVLYAVDLAIQHHNRNVQLRQRRTDAPRHRVRNHHGQAVEQCVLT